MDRIYFLPFVNDSGIDEIFDCCVEDAEKATKSLDQTLYFIKLPYGVTEIPSCLSSYTQYDEAGVSVILYGPDWLDPNAPWA